MVGHLEPPLSKQTATPSAGSAVWRFWIEKKPRHADVNLLKKTMRVLTFFSPLVLNQA
jgi:hypothetical protein